VLIDQFRFLPKSFRPLFENPSRLSGDDDAVWAPFERRLSEATVSLLSSSGLYVVGQQMPFDAAGERECPTWGDPSFRAIPRSTAQGQLGAMHLHVNTDDVLADHEIALPLRRLDELVSEGVVGRSAETHYSVMGYQREGLDAWRSETAPAIVAGLQAENVDGVVLSPACPGCSQNIPVLARMIERAGIPTVVVTMMPSLAETMGAPRVVGVEFPFGHAFGMPGDATMQREVLRAALRLLAGAAAPGQRIDVDIDWPVPTAEAYKSWQPVEPAPLILAAMARAREQRTLTSAT
jgi:D-proline reductase (dithiol) PrdB